MVYSLSIKFPPTTHSCSYYNAEVVSPISSANAVNFSTSKSSCLEASSISTKSGLSPVISPTSPSEKDCGGTRGGGLVRGSSAGGTVLGMERVLPPWTASVEAVRLWGGGINLDSRLLLESDRLCWLPACAISERDRFSSLMSSSVKFWGGTSGARL